LMVCSADSYACTRRCSSASACSMNASARGLPVALEMARAS
jgi:hypothetical protein